MGDTSLVFAALGKDRVSKMLGLVRRGFVATGEAAADASDKASDAAGKLDRKIEEVEGGIKELSREFAKTNDQELFKKIAKEQRLLRNLRNIRKELDDVGDEAGRAGRKIGTALAGNIGGRLGAVLPGSVSKVFQALPPQVQAVAAAVGAALAYAAGTAFAAALSAAILLGIGGLALGGGIAGALATDEATKKIDKVRESLAAAKDEVTSLRERFAETGDADLLPDIAKAEREVARLEGKLKTTKKDLKDIAVIEAFRNLGKQAKKSLSGFIEPFRAPLVRAAGTFGGMFKRLEPAFTRIGKAVAPLIDKLAPAFASMAEKAMPGIEKAVTASLPLFNTLAKHAPKIGESIGKFFSLISQSAPQANMFFGHLLTALEHIIPAIGMMIARLAAGYGTAVAVVRGIKAVVVGAVNGIRAGLSALAALPGRVGAWFGGMVTQARIRLGAMVALARSLPGRIRSAVGNLGRVLYAAGRNIIQGLINGIRAALGRLRSTLSGITGLIPDWKGPMSRDRRLLEPTGAAIMAGLNRGLVGALPAVRGTLTGVTDQIGATSPTVRGAGGGGGGVVTVRLVVDGADSDMLRMLRKMVRVEGRGDVQVAFGRG